MRVWTTKARCSAAFKEGRKNGEIAGFIAAMILFGPLVYFFVFYALELGDGSGHEWVMLTVTLVWCLIDRRIQGKVNRLSRKIAKKLSIKDDTQSP